LNNILMSIMNVYYFIIQKLIVIIFMKILVLGSGLLGVTTAYELGKRGFEVTVIDRQNSSAAETSFANGGQLSYSHAEPWASPTVLPKLPKWLFHADSPLVFRPRADLDMIRWGLSFLRNCTSSRSDINTVSMLRLGLFSRECLHVIKDSENLEFNHSDKGILHIYGTKEEFEHGKRQVEFQAKFGGDEKIITRDEVLALEPALAHSSQTIVGGIHAHHDESGDAHAFCTQLAEIATGKFGVKFMYGVTVNDIKRNGRKIVAIDTNKGDMRSEGYVLSLGSYSSVHLRKIGIRVPIYPMKGYSITIEANDFCPNISLTDGTHKIVYSRLGNKLRVAGTAEFAGYDQSINEERIVPIVRAAKNLVPKADWNQEIGKWACLRPSTPDGPPIIGRTPYNNLFLNTGHGTLGWTQAAGSATLLADIMENKTPKILLHGLTLGRYKI
jgi:D-amino-acid dehydrogenase